MKAYDESAIQTLKGLEHIRLLIHKVTIISPDPIHKHFPGKYSSLIYKKNL